MKQFSVQCANQDPIAFPTNEVNNYRESLYIKYIDLLTNHLNKIHEQSHNKRYWEIIVGPWLIYFIYYIHYRFTILSNKPRLDFSQKYETFNVPYDFLSFTYLFQETNYVQQLDQLLLKNLDARTLTNWVCFQSIPLQYRSVKKIVYNLLALSIGWFARFSKIILASPGMSIKSQIKIWFKSGLKIFSFFDNDNPPHTIAINPNMRIWKEPLRLFSNTDLFDTLLGGLIIKQLPCIYVEDYSRVIKKISHLALNKKVLLSATGWMQNESFKLLAALSQEQGAKLIGYQHGGFYGTGKVRYAEFEKKITDCYLTWGWKDSEKTCPFESLKLLETYQKFLRLSPSKKTTIDILLITTSDMVHRPDGLGQPSGEELTEYFNWELRFIKVLNEYSTSYLKVRLNPYESFYGWNQKNQIKSLNINIQFDESKTFEKALSNAKLAICDNNLTTLLECYTCNVPTVIFFDKKLWPLNQLASDLFERMEQVGLYHSNPESAATHINTIASNPLDWWNSSDVKKVREEYKEKYARFTPHALKNLTSFLLTQAGFPSY